ncbi:MAG: hypothetical protein ACI8VI_001495 [Granulosicoccus sp.]|jgi:hypothetical protein
MNTSEAIVMNAASVKKNRTRSLLFDYDISQ